jgi:RimJ/RimL family protein N-acetyltransferase
MPFLQEGACSQPMLSAARVVGHWQRSSPARACLTRFVSSTTLLVNQPNALELPRPDLTDGSIALRAWHIADADELVRAVPEPDPGLPRWESAEEARDWIGRQRTRLTERVGYPFAIVSCETGAVHGFVGLWLRPDGSAAFGYWILPHARGRGLATRAVKLLARWANDELAIEVLEIAAEPGNIGSIRVAERSGFELVGPISGYRDAGGGVHDVLLYRCRS